MDYEIIHSSRRTLALEITREGRVIIRAPRRCPQSQIDRFLLLREDWIKTHLELQQARLSAHPEPDDAKKAELIARARAELPEKAAKYAEIMGLYPTGITITSARTRFGSCSPKNRICFSWRLMEFPEEAIDYVVVHELAHIAEKSHGKGFYALIEAVLPDWKARRALLKE